MQVIYLAALIKGSLEWRCYVSWTSGLTQSDWSIITFCSIYQHLAFDACTRMLTPNSFRCLTSKDNVNLKSKHTHTLTIYNNLRPHVLGGIFTLFENEFRSLICFSFFFFKHYIPHQLDTKLVLLWLWLIDIPEWTQQSISLIITL